MPFTNQHHGACYGRMSWQTIEHPIVGDKAIPTHAALLSSKALPRIVFGQGPEVLFHPQLQRHGPGGAMHFLVEAITPDPRLRIEVIDIAKAYPRPEALFDDTDTALHFAFGLRFIGIPLANWPSDDFLMRN